MSDTVVVSRWHDPEPLPTDLSPVAPFDPDMLPNSVRGYVMDCADRMNCPPDYIAVANMCAMGSVVGRQLAVRPKQHDSWEVIPNLFGAIIGSPSSRKSPALDTALAPVMKLEATARSEHREAMREYETEKLTHDLALNSAKKNASRRLNEDNSELGRRAAKVDIDAVANMRPEEPYRRVYVTQDATCEMLGELLNKNPNGFIIWRDELTGWMNELDKAGREGARGFFLQAWNGNGSFRVDRIGRGTIEVPALCLSVFGGIQPDKLRAYFRSVVNGSADDGLLARFQLMVWPDPVKLRSVDRSPNKEARDQVDQLFLRLADLPLDEIGAIQNGDQVPYLRLCQEASTLFAEWELALRTRAQDETPAMEAHMCKYPSMVASIALLHHLADGYSGPVSHASLSKAIAWAEYLESHTRRIYAPLLAPDMDAAIKLAKKITDGKLDNQFGLRELYRKGWSGLIKPETVMKAAEILEDFGWLKIEERDAMHGSGRPPGPVCVINPKLKIK